MKILFWDRRGFVLYYKRLERGRSPPARDGGGRTVEMDATELGMLLDGIDVSRVRRPAKWEPRRPGRRGNSTLADENLDQIDRLEDCRSQGIDADAKS